MPWLVREFRGQFVKVAKYNSYEAAHLAYVQQLLDGLPDGHSLELVHSSLSERKAT